MCVCVSGSFNKKAATCQRKEHPVLGTRRLGWTRGSALLPTDFRSTSGLPTFLRMGVSFCKWDGSTFARSPGARWQDGPGSACAKETIPVMGGASTS